MNVHAGIGHNSGSPFAGAAKAVDLMWIEAAHWLDGSVAQSQAEADAIGRILADTRDARKAADKARRDEAKPFDDGKAEVQARYKPLLDRCDLIADGAKKALAPFLAAQERAKRYAEAVAREAAEAARKASSEAFARAQGIEDRERAEAKAVEARNAEIAARAAANDTAGAKGGARKIGLRTTVVPEITDLHALMGWIWTNDRSALAGFAETYVAGAFRAGQREMAGVRAVERETVA